jgi:S-formylglutathione hydrolase FrmB
MRLDVNNIVIIPEGYDKDATYPVLYLLHGYSGNHYNWMHIKPNLPGLASCYNMIIVCPDGKNSWYWDSPVNPQSQYETYVSQELVKYIDDNYQTIQSPKGRAIAGLSMGGHGALWLAINHQDVFGACGSISGGVDIRPFAKKWDMSKWMWEYESNKEAWNKHTVINQIDKIKNLSIIVDCGVDDFFYEVNENLHKKLMENKIPHDYIVRPGEHNNPYWNNAIDYQILFFSKFFNRKDK